MKKFAISIVILLGMSSFVYAKSAIESIGDVFAIAIPAGAYSTSLYLGDKDGQMQFYKSYGTTMGATIPPQKSRQLFFFHNSISTMLLFVA